ncbi:MAG: kynureninase [Runella sp.]
MWPKNSIESLEWAKQQDAQDPLAKFRQEFLIPADNRQNPLIYLCGNSLGLQPRMAREAISKELDIWQTHGVEGWFEGQENWLGYHKRCQSSLAAIVGALDDEVCPMNQLTVNLHLMLASFYQPTDLKYKILTVAADFPSDQYALETHLRFRGYDPDEALIEISPKTGAHTIDTEDILKAIEQNQHQLALVCMSGLHYYTGQFFDIQTIAEQAHRFGVWVGFDLAHAVGNVPLQLHDWGVDFAVWCSYKYLNSGPGGIAGVFVHQKHHQTSLPRLAGWWGYDEPRRFEMTKGFVPMQGAAGWQLSTPNILALATHHASLKIFDATSMATLRQKSLLLTGFLEFLIHESNRHNPHRPIEIITPSDPQQRGCQLSLLVENGGKQLFEQLVAHGIIGDWREPNCIRLSPVPLYNTFEEIWRVGSVLSSQ